MQVGALMLSSQPQVARTHPIRQLSSTTHTVPLQRRTSALRRLAPRLDRQSAVFASKVEIKTGEKWWERGTVPNMKTVNSVDDFILELSQARDKLVVVDFFARWCGSCKALYPKLCKLSQENPDILLLKVNFDDNKQLARALDVKVLPWFQFYRGSEGRVAAFSASVAKVQRLRDALELYSSPRCSLGTTLPIAQELTSLLNTQDGTVVPGPSPDAAQQQPEPVAA